MELSKHKLSRRALLTLLVGGAGGAALIGGASGVIPLSAKPAPNRGDVTLYKNPQCGCCEGYADYLRDNGFKVKAISTNDLTVMGQKYGIPGRHAAVPHLADRRLCRVRSHSHRSRQPAALRSTANRRDYAAGYARGNAWYARKQARPVGHLRDQIGRASCRESDTIMIVTVSLKRIRD